MDPIWIDANTLMRIAEGDTALLGELLEMRAAGRQILVVPKVFEEATVGNPFRANRPAPNMNPETVSAVNAAFNRLGAVRDIAGTAEDRAIFYQNGGLTPGRGGQLPSARHEGDFVVLSQIAASARARGICQPILFSLDDAMRGTHAPRFGIGGITRTTTPVRAPTATVGGPASPPSVSGPANSIAGPLIQGAHIIIKNGLNQISQQKAQDEAMAEYQRQEPAIRNMLMGNPGMGVRIDFYFTFQPGVNRDFNDIWIFEGVTSGLNPGAATPIASPSVPRGEPKHFAIFLPPDPNAKKAPPPKMTTQSVAPDLTRLWNVNIGAWKGIFEFDSNGVVYWAESLKDLRHYGRWWVAPDWIQFQFDDDPPNRKRMWVIKSSLMLKVVTGYVEPEGVNGFFDMTRAEWWNANGG